jgi:hypothetical protein
MAFPVSPTEGQTFTENNTVWIYSAVMGQWNRSVINPLNETLYKFGSASATGNAGEIQYTDGTNLAASPNLLWDNANNELEVGGDVVLDDGGTYTTTLQTITPTAARTISFPDATGTVALVAGSSGQLVYNNAGAQAGAPGSVVGATGDVTLGLNGAASTPPLDITGTWFTGGTSTTTKPQVLIEPAGTTSTAWSTSGTGLGVNATSGFTGRLLDLQTNGTSRAVVTGAGNVGIGTTSPNNTLHVAAAANHGITLERTGTNPGSCSLNVNSNGALQASANSSIFFNAGTGYSVDFGGNNTFLARILSDSRFVLGSGAAATTSFPALKRSSAILQVRLADDSAYSTIDAQLRSQGSAPATASDTGVAGDIRYDADYIYVCTATNTWKRTAISTW